MRVLLTAVVWFGLTALLVAAGELVTHSGLIDQFDRRVTNWAVAQRSYALDTTMKAITWCGSWVAVAITGGLLVVLVAMRRLPLIVVILATAGWVGEVAAVNVVKTWVDRQRPPRTLWLVTAHGSSFPSGHAANATLVFATLGFVWCLHTVHRASRIAGLTVSVLGTLMVGFSRVELGVHWTSDVLAGFFVAAAWLVGFGYLLGGRLPRSPNTGANPGTLVQDLSLG